MADDLQALIDEIRRIEGQPGGPADPELRRLMLDGLNRDTTPDTSTGDGTVLFEQTYANGETGRVVVGPSGAEFRSPGFSTRDVDTIERIMGGATPAEAQTFNPVVNEGGRGGAMARSGLQGLTFGFGDEIVAGGAAALGPGNYSQNLAAERARLGQGRAEYPVATTGAEIAGAAGTAIAAGYGRLPAMASTGQKTRAGAAIGSAEGATYGFGSGEGGLQNRAERALYGAAGGAALGAAAPLAVDATVATGRRFLDPLAGAVGIGNRGRAESAVARGLQGADMTGDDIAQYLRGAQADGQGVATVADAMGPSGQRLLAGTARQPGPGRTQAIDFLEERQLGQSDRLGEFLTDAMRDTRPNAPPPLAQGGTAEQVRSGLVSARGAAADTAYTAARQGAGPVDVRGALSVIDARLGPMRNNAGVTGDGIDGTLSRFRDRLSGVAPDGTRMDMADFNRVLGIKQDVQDAIGVAQRAGRNNEARELTKLITALDEALEASSDGYRAANDGFREASRVIDSVETGQSANRPGVRADDYVQQYGGMTPDQQAAARLGYLDTQLGRIENAAPTTNQARTLRSPRQRTNLDAMANDPARLNRQIDRENTMFETRRGVVGGSQTAELLADQAQANSEDVGIIANLLSGRPGAAGVQVLGRSMNALQGRNEDTRAQIVRMLLASDPQALNNALQRFEGNEGVRRLIESMMRGSGREPATNAVEAMAR